MLGPELSFLFLSPRQFIMLKNSDGWPGVVSVRQNCVNNLYLPLVSVTEPQAQW